MTLIEEVAEIFDILRDMKSYVLVYELLYMFWMLLGQELIFLVPYKY